MDLPSDLFSVLFKCQSHERPWRSLLAHAIALQRPLLAVLAACYEVGGSSSRSISPTRKREGVEQWKYKIRWIGERGRHQGKGGGIDENVGDHLPQSARLRCHSHTLENVANAWSH